MARIHRLAILLAAGTLATGATPADALAGAGRRAPVAQRGWVLVPADSAAASDAAERLAGDLGIGPDKAQEIIDAAYH